MRLLLVMLLVSPLFADDAWAKLKEVKSGTEIRIIKVGAKQPVIAKMDELTDENLIVVVKNEQLAIAKDQIDRVDARPKGGRPITRETTMNKDTTVPPEAPPINRPNTTPGPTGSMSSGVSIGDKPDFVTVYKRGTK
jgi:hypothetical protein